MAETYVCEICLAVKDLEAVKRFYEDIIGLKLEKESIIVEGTPGVAKMATYRLGNLVLNIMTPVGPQSVVLNRSLEKRGEGIHHFCFSMPPKELDRVFKKCKETDIRLVGPDGELVKPGGRVGYTDPRSTHRTIIELIDRAM